MRQGEKQILYEDDKQEKQVQRQKQIPFGNDKQKATAEADSLRE